jgi:hypothetical protein
MVEEPLCLKVTGFPSDATPWLRKLELAVAALCFYFVSRRKDYEHHMKGGRHYRCYAITLRVVVGSRSTHESIACQDVGVLFPIFKKESRLRTVHFLPRI